jgi:hypothetical protein
MNSQFGIEKWLWGNTPSVDIIQLERNEGATYLQDLHVLFAGMPVFCQSYEVQSLMHTQLLAMLVILSHQLLPYPRRTPASH